MADVASVIGIALVLLVIIATTAVARTRGCQRCVKHAATARTARDEPPAVQRMVTDESEADVVLDAYASESELVAEAELVLTHLRRRAPVVARQEGYPVGAMAQTGEKGDRALSPSVRNRVYTHAPSPRPNEHTRVIDPKTCFFRKGKYTNDVHGRVTAVDENYERIVGMPFDEMQVSGTGWVANLSPLDFVPVMRRWLYCLEKRHTFVMKYRFRHPYRTVYAVVVSRGVFTNGKYTGSTGNSWHVDEETWKTLDL